MGVSMLGESFSIYNKYKYAHPIYYELQGRSRIWTACRFHIMSPDGCRQYNVVYFIIITIYDG